MMCDSESEEEKSIGQTVFNLSTGEGFITPKIKSNERTRNPYGPIHTGDKATDSMSQQMPSPSDSTNSICFAPRKLPKKAVRRVEQALREMKTTQSEALPVPPLIMDTEFLEEMGETVYDQEEVRIGLDNLVVSD
jgi:hypothetical protein